MQVEQKAVGRQRNLGLYISLIKRNYGLLDDMEKAMH
jgi:hypothetical protein